MTKLICSDPNYSNLLQAVRSGKVVVFVGSGLSKAAGYQGWGQLISKLCYECGILFPSGEPVTSSQLLELADSCWKEDPEKYQKILTSEFSKPVTVMPRNYTYLYQSPFKSYVTTNFDPLLAEEGRQGKSDIYTHKNGLDVSRLSKKSIFYIHGYVQVGKCIEANKLILTKSDFEREYNPDTSIKIISFLTQLFQFHSVVFIGCQLREEPIRKLFEICERARIELQESSEQQLPKHYILLPNSDIKAEGIKSDKQQKEVAEYEDEWYEKNGITVVRYDKQDEEPKHIQLQDILEEWSGLPMAKVISPFDSEEPIA